MWVTVEQAARELEMTQMTLRYLMLHGMLPIGDAWKKEGRQRGCYRVNRKLLDEEKARRGIEAVSKTYEGEGR